MALVSHVFLWSALFVLSLLVVGLLGIVNRIGWRLEQLEASTPHRVGRSGIKVGAQAPPFSGQTSGGDYFESSAWCGKRFVLVLLKIGCQPCERIVPHLNRLQQKSTIPVVALLIGKIGHFGRWEELKRPTFPVLLQEDESILRRYQVGAVPFAFLVDKDQSIIAKGVVSRKQHLDFLLEKAAGPHERDLLGACEPIARDDRVLNRGVFS